MFTRYGYGLGLPSFPVPYGDAGLPWPPSDADLVFFLFNASGAMGFYGDAIVRDTVTPANNYDDTPDKEAASLLTYSAPAAKLVRGPDGLMRYGAHNLYISSAAPANRSVTLVSGATYAITITGSVSVTASGAAAGTWTAGTTEFTAATGTLTLGSTSGSGTVHLRRTPSDSTYIQTGAVEARCALPFEWDAAGALIGILMEKAATNLCLYSNDLTQAAWSKTDCAAALTATGPGGVANSVSTLTASAGNATALQSITSGSTSRVTHVWLKRRTGTGNIDLTQDNGSTWATQAVTSTWTRFVLASVTSANPIVGLRIVTSGDAVDVAYFQHETGLFPTSPVVTYAAAVTRALDNLYLEPTKINLSATVGTVIAKAGNVPTNATAFSTLLTLGTGIYQTLKSSTQARGYLFSGSYIFGNMQANWDGSGRMAFAWAADDAALVAGGAVIATDVAGTPLDPETTASASFKFGNDSSIHIRELAYIPRRLTDAELEELTA